LKESYVFSFCDVTALKSVTTRTQFHVASDIQAAVEVIGILPPLCFYSYIHHIKEQCDKLAKCETSKRNGGEVSEMTVKFLHHGRDICGTKY
jgi:hypothetical protein